MEETTEKIKRFFEEEQAEFRDQIEVFKKTSKENPDALDDNYSNLLSWIAGHSGKLYALLEQLTSGSK